MRARALIVGVALLFTIGLARAAQAPQKPDDTRFYTVTLVPPGELDEPMTFSVAGEPRLDHRAEAGAQGLRPGHEDMTKRRDDPGQHEVHGAAGTVREAEEGSVRLHPRSELRRTAGST